MRAAECDTLCDVLKVYKTLLKREICARHNIHQTNNTHYPTVCLCVVWGVSAYSFFLLWLKEGRILSALCLFEEKVGFLRKQIMYNELHIFTNACFTNQPSFFYFAIFTIIILPFQRRFLHNNFLHFITAHASTKHYNFQLIFLCFMKIINITAFITRNQQFISILFSFSCF